jgi:hypothetical protein
VNVVEGLILFAAGWYALIKIWGFLGFVSDKYPRFGEILGLFLAVLFFAAVAGGLIFNLFAAVWLIIFN